MTYVEAARIMMSGGRVPVIKPLTVTENGLYTAPSGIDGYDPVSVGVPDRYDEGYQKGYDDGYKDGYKDGFQYASDIINGNTTPQEETLPNGDTVTFPNGYVPTDNPDDATDLVKTFTGLADGDNTGTAVNLDNGYKLVVTNIPFDGSFPAGQPTYGIAIVEPNGTAWSLGSNTAYGYYYPELVDFRIENGGCYHTAIVHRPGETPTTETYYTSLADYEIEMYNEWASGTNYGCGVGETT